MRNLKKSNIVYPIIVLLAVIIFGIFTSDAAPYNPFPPKSLREGIWACVFIMMWATVSCSLLWLCYGLIELKYHNKLKAIKEKITIPISEEFFEFYQQLETNSNRFNQLLSQRNNNKLYLKPGFNLTALILPIPWLARLKLVSPVFIFWIIIFFSYLLMAITNNSYEALDVSLRVAALFTIFFVLIIRIILAIWGKSIEVIFFVKRMTPHFIFYKSTGNIPDDMNKSFSRNWFSVFIIWLIYTISLIPFINALNFH